MRNGIGNKLVKNALYVLLIGCAIGQFLLTTYFNIFEGRNHLDIDSSVEYAETLVIGTHGGFYPVNLLHETTQPSNEKVFLLSAPLYRLTNNIWLAHGLTNMIMTLFIVALIFGVCRKWGGVLQYQV